MKHKQKKIEYPPPGPELSGGWTNLLRIFGPGAIIATVTVGTGETIFAPRIGAVFGYAMLWVIVVTVMFKAVQVYTGARYLVLTGEHPMQAWARIPGPRAWAAWLIGLVAVTSFPLWIAALADAVSSLCVWITGVGGEVSWGRPLWGTVIIVVAMLFSLVQTYNVIERVSTVILVFKVILIFIAVMVIKPDWVAAWWGFVTPQLPDYQPWVATSYPKIAANPSWLEMAVLMGAVGGGVQDYVGYVGFLREKKWGAAGLADCSPQNLPNDKKMIARGKQWLRAPAFDTIVSFGSVLLITCCFMILGAAVLHPRQLVPDDADLYSKQSQFLGLVHPALVTIYKAGIFFAIFGVIYAAFELYTRTAYESLRALWPKREWDIRKLRLWVVLYSGLGGLAILWTGFQTVRIAKYISPLSGVLGCGLWCLAMIWVERTQLPRTYRMKGVLLLLTIIAGIAMTLIGGYVTVRNWSN
ncbi:MAG: Nramp family divalent metal transporter [Pyrinomonadaceae bacterium]|nr:Nramp family divalent metal transporter [Pyrinomonadaceae bacterium]